jgi:hypothetical protein
MEKIEKTGKSSLIKSAKNLVSQKKELLTQIKDLQGKYQSLSVEYQPQINEFQTKAEDLAKEFRRLYSKSQEAYSSGDGASAKSLSLAGHALEEKCRAINNKTNVLRNELKSILNKIQLLRKKAGECQIQTNECYKQAATMRKTYVRGFGLSKIMSDDDVEEFLDEFPQKVFKKIESIKFKNKLVGNESATILGNHHWDEKLGKFEIDIYYHISENSFNLKETITHEIGHTIFRSFMKDIPDRWQWGEWYKESMRSKKFILREDPGGREEDFCDCFAQFKIDPEYLEKFDKQRYDFINKIYQDIKQREDQ